MSELKCLKEPLDSIQLQHTETHCILLPRIPDTYKTSFQTNLYTFVVHVLENMAVCLQIIKTKIQAHFRTNRNHKPADTIAACDSNGQEVIHKRQARKTS